MRFTRTMTLRNKGVCKPTAMSNQLTTFYQFPLKNTQDLVAKSLQIRLEIGHIVV